MPPVSRSRAELADLVNERVYAGSGRVIELSANYVGMLERGQIRWPQAAYRAGLRTVLGVGTDAELGFRRPRRSRSTVTDVDGKDFLRATPGVTATTIAPHLLADLVTPTEPTPGDGMRCMVRSDSWGTRRVSWPSMLTRARG